MDKDKNNQQQGNLFDIRDNIIPEDKRLFLPTWDNKPPQQENIITVQGKRVLTTGNILSIVSKPGVGKTSLCEGLIASILNPDCDSLGFNVALSGSRYKVLFIDTERTIHDTWNSWERTYTRAGIKKPKIDKRVIFANFKAVNISQRRNHVEEILKANWEVGLIVFDGAGDFIPDTNSIPETNLFIDWINTFNPAISIVATLHTNPRESKPRGHLGSELCRRSESVFLVQKIENGRVREITTSFEYGKVRNDDDEISYFYKYSEHDQMFISTDHTPKKIIATEKEENHREVISKIFDGRLECSTSHIISKIAEIAQISDNAAKGSFYRNYSDKLLKKEGDGWRLQNSYK